MENMERKKIMNGKKRKTKVQVRNLRWENRSEKAVAAAPKPQEWVAHAAVVAAAAVDAASAAAASYHSDRRQRALAVERRAKH